MNRWMCAAAIGAALWSGVAFAAPQDKEKKEIRHEEIKVVTGGGAAVAGDFLVEAPPPIGGQIGRHANMAFVSSEFAWEEKSVKGAPYAAEAVTETTQVLADGNRITRKNSAQVYRDGEGRTRREQTIGGVGPFAAGQTHRTIFINDPVARVNYILEPDSKIARKLALPKLPENFGAADNLQQFEIRTEMIGGGAPAPHGMIMHRMLSGGEPDKMNYANAPLGKQTIEGLVCDGTKMTMTIAAGEIGNERPIEVVTEKWYSPELQTNVMTRTSDPRFGETVFKLSSVRRGEPGPSYFEPPADYKMEEMGGPKVRTMEFRQKKD